jgi:endoglucanase
LLADDKPVKEQIMHRRIIISAVFLMLFLFSIAPAPAFFDASRSGSAFDIRLNSLGFLPTMPKKASIIKSCAEFTVKKASDDSIVYSGKTAGPVHQDDVNQDLWIADFSSVGGKGKFYLDVPGIGKSCEFEIGDNVYDFAYYTTMRGFYLWRCGCAVEGEHNGNQYSHGPCHLNDAYQDYMGIDDNSKRDGTKGWHDAGDYGKYTVNAGITMGCLFMAWDHFKDKLEKISLDIPETAPGCPDFLEELKWETDWLLTMQYPDGSGRVSHKLTRVNFSGFVMPETDTEKRYFTDWGTAATADFVAVMAMAARYFKPYDAEYAQKCLDAAKISYEFLQKHPEPKRFQQGDFKTGGYQTDDPDDRFWAAAEMWETTGDAACLKDLQTRIAASTAGGRRRGGEDSGSKVDEDWDWGNVRNLGMFTYVLSKRQGRNAELLEDVRQDIIATADAIVANANQDVYGRTLTRYYWGCNGGVARQALNLQVANKISPKKEYLDAALDAIGHLFGRNYYCRSYVTGLGINPPMFPHDRRSGADDVKDPWPGYVVGGSNPGATAWQDIQDDYRTNEIAINWQAGLVYALAGFTSGGQTK